MQTRILATCKNLKPWDSSNINDVIRAVLNFFFFHDKILQVQKPTLKYV